MFITAARPLVPITDVTINLSLAFKSEPHTLEVLLSGHDGCASLCQVCAFLVTTGMVLMVCFRVDGAITARPGRECTCNCPSTFTAPSLGSARTSKRSVRLLSGEKYQLA